jgi:hypothetical protein
MVRDPVLITVPIKELRPTQITVGFHEVAEKRRHWSSLPDEKREHFVASHMVPVLLGPKGQRYVTDHHHLVLALHREGAKNVAVTVIKDLSTLDKSAFWVFIDNRALCHPYNAEGKRVDFSNIPKTIDGLIDDPFRSLAGALRRNGGYAKDTTPFSEFLWADFLRRRIKLKTVLNDFAAATVEALSLAKSPAAKFLPGWCGASADD